MSRGTVARTPGSRRAPEDGRIETRESSISHTRRRARRSASGELDIATAEAVAKRLAVLRDRHESVLLDLDGLTFIDASGVRLVLAAAADSRRDGWAFAVTHGSRQVRRVFVLLGLDRHLPYD